MENAIGIRFLQFFQDRFEHLHVVILLIGNNVNRRIVAKFLVFQFGGSKILGNVNRSAIGAQNQFFIEAFFFQINPNRAVLFFEENTFFQAFVYALFA